MSVRILKRRPTELEMRSCLPVILPVGEAYYFGGATAQLKLAESFVSPVPLYRATCGYAQSGRRMATPFAGTSSTYFVATIRTGAAPPSTHSIKAVNKSS